MVVSGKLSSFAALKVSKVCFCLATLPCFPDCLLPRPLGQIGKGRWQRSNKWNIWEASGGRKQKKEDGRIMRSCCHSLTQYQGTVKSSHSLTEPWINNNFLIVWLLHLGWHLPPPQKRWISEASLGISDTNECKMYVEREECKCWKKKKVQMEVAFWEPPTLRKLLLVVKAQEDGLADTLPVTAFSWP